MLECPWPGSVVSAAPVLSADETANDVFYRNRHSVISEAADKLLCRSIPKALHYNASLIVDYASIQRAVDA